MELLVHIIKPRNRRLKNYICVNSLINNCEIELNLLEGIE